MRFNMQSELVEARHVTCVCTAACYNLFRTAVMLHFASIYSLRRVVKCYTSSPSVGQVAILTLSTVEKLSPLITVI